MSSLNWLTPWSPKTKVAVVLAQFGFAGDECDECEKLLPKLRAPFNVMQRRGSMRELEGHDHRSRYIRVRKTRLRTAERIEPEAFAMMCLIFLLIVLLAPLWYVILFLALLTPTRSHGSRHASMC